MVGGVERAAGDVEPAAGVEGGALLKSSVPRTRLRSAWLLKVAAPLTVIVPEFCTVICRRSVVSPPPASKVLLTFRVPPSTFSDACALLVPTRRDATSAVPPVKMSTTAWLPGRGPSRWCCFAQTMVEPAWLTVRNPMPAVADVDEAGTDNVAAALGAEQRVVGHVVPAGEVERWHCR